MSLKFHKVFNFCAYIICLIWGEYYIMNHFKSKIILVFTLSFTYSAFLYFQFKKISTKIISNH